MDIKNGLTDKEVLSNKNKYGSNAITNTKAHKFWKYISFSRQYNIVNAIKLTF